MSHLINDMAAELHAAGLDEGLAVTGDYQPRSAHPGAPPQDVRAWVRRGIQQIGYDGRVVGSRDEVWYLLADIAPAAGDRFTAAGRTWINQDCYEEGNGLSRWVVQAAPPPEPDPEPTP